MGSQKLVTKADKDRKSQVLYGNSIQKESLHQLHPLHSSILNLQQTYGNRYVQGFVEGNKMPCRELCGKEGPSQTRHLMPHSCSSCPFHTRSIKQMTPSSPPSGGVIQTKLKVGKLGDKYEQEADRVAEQVMRMPEPKLQRQCTTPKCEEEKIRPMQISPLQLSSLEVTTENPEVTPNIEARINTIRGNGQPLPKAVRTFMESRFGIDFSGVRIHTDKNAARLSRELNAQAFTIGKDIYFGAGRYQQNTVERRYLLAHELTHVLQQRGTTKPGGGTSITQTLQFQRFRNCTPSVTGLAQSQGDIDNLIHHARQTAIRLTTNAITVIDHIRQGTASINEQTTLRNNFGGLTPAQIQIVQNRYSIILRRIRNDNVFICNRADSLYCRQRGWYAYTWCRGSIIRLCPGAFFDPIVRSSLHLFIIHEAAHLAGACDDCYHNNPCYPPNTNGHNNADSYAFFARDVAPRPALGP